MAVALPAETGLPACSGKEERTFSPPAPCPPQTDPRPGGVGSEMSRVYEVFIVFQRRVMAAKRPIRSPRLVILGCGRWSMTDDQAGLLIAERVAAHPRAGVQVLVAEDPCCALGSALTTPADDLWVVDSALADDAHPASTWTVLDLADVADILKRGGTTTHGLNLPLALDLAAALGTLPPRVRLYVVFVRDIGRGLDINPDVAQTVERVVQRILEDLDSWEAARHA